MRSGRLLAQDSPENLLKDYRLPSLEDVFLKLCMKDGANKTAETTTSDETDYDAAQRSLGGIDNMAFTNSASQFDVSQAGIERHPNFNHVHSRSLASYTVVSIEYELR